MIWGLLFSALALGSSALRTVTGTSCDSMRINVGLGMTTQINFEQEPKVTLFADKLHFKIVTNPAASRNVAIIPVVEPSELAEFRDSKGRMLPPVSLAKALDDSFKTNLFVIFPNGNQLVFDLRFVDKNRVDYVVKVNQVFKEECPL